MVGVHINLFRTTMVNNLKKIKSSKRAVYKREKKRNGLYKMWSGSEQLLRVRLVPSLSLPFQKGLGPNRGVARNFQRGATVCHTQGTHHIVMSRILLYETNFNSKLFNRSFWGQSIENSSNLRLFASQMLYVVHLKNKKSPKGREGGRAPQDPLRYALGAQRRLWS